MDLLVPLLILLVLAAVGWTLRAAHLAGEAATARQRVADARDAILRTLAMAGPWPSAPIPPPDWRMPGPRMAMMLASLGEDPIPYRLRREQATFAADLRPGREAPPSLPPPPEDASAHQRLAWSAAAERFAEAARILARRHQDLLARLDAASLQITLPHADDAQPTVRLLDSHGDEILRDTLRTPGLRTF